MEKYVIGLYVLHFVSKTGHIFILGITPLKAEIDLNNFWYTKLLRKFIFDLSATPEKYRIW